MRRKVMVAIILLGLFFFTGRVLAASPVDSDNDGFPDDVEIKLGTDPHNPDTDGDGFSDGVEVANGFNPLKGDGDREVKRSVEVDLNTQSLGFFMNGVRLGTFLVSSGRPGFPTPTGNFAILRKRPVVHYHGVGFDHPNTPWNLEFKKGFYLHTAYWHNQFGIRPVSGGCVNLARQDAEKMYKFLEVGDKVKIFGQAPLKVASK